MIRLVVICVSLLFAAAAQAADIAGRWEGTWNKNTDVLPVHVTFERSIKGYSGSFESDVLQRGGIPLLDVSVAGERVHFVLKGDRTSIVFDGRTHGKAIDGSLAENDLRGTFHLVKAKASSPAASRDIDFRNGAVKLAGTLLVPEGKGRHPAILFLHGSGAEARFANRWLAQRFARAGFVALITDKRGVGQSSGDWKTSGFDDLAADALAGIRILQRLPEVDAKRVGIYGHSQGGTITPLVASHASDLRFVIASAAGGIDPAAIEEYSIGNSIGIASLPSTEAADARTLVKAVVDVGYRGASRDRLDALEEQFKTRPWYVDLPPSDSFYWAFSRRIADYDPSKYWRQVSAPVLLLFGAKDERVPPLQSSNAIVAALSAGGEADVTLRIFPNVDHTFSLPVASGGWPRRAANYVETMIEWAKAQTR